MATADSGQTRRWHIYHDPRDLMRHAERAVLGAAAEAVTQRDRFDLVISGGVALEQLCRRLRDRGAGDERWHIWFSDEACLPAGHRDRNETAARDLWLDHSAIPPDNIHPVPAGLEPEDAAGRYADLLDGVGPFDLVVLEVGAEGSIAALFPGYGLAEFEDAPDVLAVHGPRPPHARVTLSAERLGQARQVALLVTGEGKQDSIAAWRSGVDMPVGRLRPTAGIDVFADEGAMPGF